MLESLKDRRAGGAGDEAQWLRVHTTLAEDPSSVSRLVDPKLPVTPAPGNPHYLLASLGACTHVHIHSHREWLFVWAGIHDTSMYFPFSLMAHNAILVRMIVNFSRC